MAVNITEADAYIGLNVLVIEDWQDSDSARKQRLLNVAARELGVKFPDYVIPDNAVYEFAAVLANAFNDTNKLQQEGVASFSISGISFAFKGGAKEMADFIPKAALDLIGAENGVELGGKRSVKWTVI